jgi:hypothetical protein
MIALTSILIAIAAQGAAAVPAQDDVRQALADQLAARCGDDDACIARQPAVEVRALNCQAAGPDLATCRYETRTGAAAWRAAATRFRFDLDTSMWSVDTGEAG